MGFFQNQSSMEPQQLLTAHTERRKYGMQLATFPTNILLQPAPQEFKKGGVNRSSTPEIP
jgi:hypothetical protein